MFATAMIQQTTKTPAVLVPSSAVLTSGGTTRVFVVRGDRVEERVATTGQVLENRIEVTRGVAAGERVATDHLAQLVDGTKVR
jgi:multidrug efflux pump subunit AcrA (membrane-fusion protein)